MFFWYGRYAVLANDSDLKRAAVLAARIGGNASSPYWAQKAGGFAGWPERAGLIVTHHDATKLPLRALGSRFDAAVVDVPCSGDGTVRKDAGARGHWSPSYGISLHRTQLRIALRAVGLLRVGGVMTYSTCSLHPIEDEAVVAAMLRRCGGALELVDASGLLPGLARRPGLSSWPVLDDALKTFAELNEAQANAADPVNTAARATMWPPPRKQSKKATPAARPPLERCFRIVPHDSDSGGFFIALLRKTGPWPPQSEQHGDLETPAAPAVAAADNGGGDLAQSGRFRRLPAAVAHRIAAEVGLGPEGLAMLTSRSLNPSQCWVLSPAAYALGTAPGVRAISGGVLALRRVGQADRWELCQEAISMLAEHVSMERVVTLVSSAPSLLGAGRLADRGRYRVPLTALENPALLAPGPCVVRVGESVVAGFVTLSESGLPSSVLWLGQVAVDAIRRAT